MIENTKRALKNTKQLHQLLSELEKGDGSDGAGVDFKRLKTLAASSNVAVQNMRRHASDEMARANIRERLLREAVRDDMIDREVQQLPKSNHFSPPYLLTLFPRLSLSCE